jgi:phage terminase large subunit GpA-like protein
MMTPMPTQTRNAWRMAATPLDTAAALTFSNLDAVLSADEEAAVNLVPPPDMLPSVWAEGNVRIPIGNAIPGPISFDNAPMQRGILDAAKEPGIRRMDLMLGAQLGKTTVLQCLVGFNIAHEPCSQILTQPSEGDMATFLETKLKPMLEANPAISTRMAKPRGRHGVNNSRMVSYIGGWLMFGWAGSPKTARGRSAPKLLMDEVDGYDVTAEGDYPELLAQRSATFGDDALQVRSSTPVELATSRIYKGFLAGDQRRYYVKCPHCGHRQFFKWENVRWIGRASKSIEDADLDLKAEHDPLTARYRCEDPECASLWDDGERIAAIRNAHKVGAGWIAGKPFKGHASFHAPEMASTFRRLRDIVQSYLDKLALGDLQSFVNVSLGWPYEAGDKADPDGLMALRETWVAAVPMGGLYLTAGVDMQMDRLEVEVVAWGIGEESWSVAVHVIWGDPLTNEPWDDLEDFLASTFKHESGATLGISAAMVDTGGTSGMTAAAYAWLQGKTGRRIFGSKGIAGWGRPIAEKPTRKQTGKRKSKFADLVRVGVDEAKLVIARRLALRNEGPGFCHFPLDDAHDADYFKQLTAERLVTRYVKGQAVREWHKGDRDRNEKLDCRVYAYAAFKLMQPTLKRIAERLGVQLQPGAAEPAQDVTPKHSPTEGKPMKFRKRERPTPPPSTAPPDATAKPQEATEGAPPNNPPAKRPRPKMPKRKGTWATTW